MRTLLVLSLSLLLTTLYACKGGGGGAVDTSLPGDPVAGAEVYNRVCVACHGADGRGNGGLGGDFIGEPQRLQQDNAFLLGEIADGINRNGRIMPPQRDALTEQERANALAYIRQTFGQH